MPKPMCLLIFAQFLSAPVKQTNHFHQPLFPWPMSENTCILEPMSVKLAEVKLCRLFKGGRDGPKK